MKSRGVISDAGQDIKKANWAGAELSEREAYIVHSIDHVGWYAYLWFPLVWICIPEQFLFSVGPSAELMQLALDIGIFPLYHCTIDGRGAPRPGL